MAKPIKETPMFTNKKPMGFLQTMKEVKIKGSPKSQIDKQFDKILKTGSF